MRNDYKELIVQNVYSKFYVITNVWMMKTEEQRIQEAKDKVELKKRQLAEKQQEIDALDPIRFARRLKKLQQEKAMLQAEYFNAINIYNIVR